MEPDTDGLTVLYGRQSLDRKNTRMAIDRQLKVGHEYCKRAGWADPSEYIDNDLSATLGGHRPRYAELINDVAAGLVKRIVVLHLSRIWRNRQERAQGIEILRKHQVMLVCVEGPTIDFTTAYGRGMAAMLGEADTLEVELKSERQLLANSQRAELGLPHGGGTRAFGYESDGITQVPAEADAIAEAYRTVVGGGSLRSIAQAWNAARLYSGKKRWGKHRGELSEWKPDSVRDVLLNPRNAGIREYRGEEYAAQWPGCIDVETYRAARAILTDPDRRPVGAYGVALLTTVATCGVCSATVHSGGGNLRGKNVAEAKRYRTYRCSENSGKHIVRKAEPIDLLVKELAIGRLSAPDAIDLVARDKPDVAALIADRETLRKRLAHLAEAFAEGDIDRAQLRAGTDKLKGRLDAIEQSIADAATVSALTPLLAASDVRATWEALDVDRKRAVLRELFEVIEILPVGRGVRTFRPDSVRIVWRQPLD